MESKKLLLAMSFVVAFLCACGGGPSSVEPPPSPPLSNPPELGPAPVWLDVSFGISGVVLGDGVSHADGDVEGQFITTSGDGSLVVAGTMGQKLFIANYTLSGDPNTSFGNAGIVVRESDSDIATVPKALIVDSLGRIIVVCDENAILFCGSDTSSFVPRLLLLRYLPDGSPDPDFGNNGSVTINDTASCGQDSYSLRSTSADSAVLDSSDRIVVIGMLSENYFDKMSLWRFTGEGELDSSFGEGDGNTSLLPSYGWEQARDIKLDSSGNIYVTGDLVQSYGRRMAVWRFSSDGRPDMNSRNSLIYDFPDSREGELYMHSSGNQIFVGDAGLITVVGETMGPVDVGEMTHMKSDLAVWHYDAEGVIDTVRGGKTILNGLAGYESSNDSGEKALMDGEGRLLVIGGSQFFDEDVHSVSVLCRFAGEGQLDESLSDGDGGCVVIRDFALSAPDEGVREIRDVAVNGAVLNSAGQLFLVGSAEVVNSDRKSFLLTKYEHGE